MKEKLPTNVPERKPSSKSKYPQPIYRREERGDREINEKKKIRDTHGVLIYTHTKKNPENDEKISAQSK